MNFFRKKHLKHYPRNDDLPEYKDVILDEQSLLQILSSKIYKLLIVKLNHGFLRGYIHIDFDIRGRTIDIIDYLNETKFCNNISQYKLIELTPNCMNFQQIDFFIHRTQNLPTVTGDKFVL